MKFLFSYVKLEVRRLTTIEKDWLIMKKMHNMVVIITGGGQGIGFGLATAFAQVGANIVITGRTLDKLQKAKETLEKAYDFNVLAIAADSSDEDAVKATIFKTVEEFDQIDVIINNADAAKSGLLLV